VCRRAQAAAALWQGGWGRHAAGGAADCGRRARAAAAAGSGSGYAQRVQRLSDEGGLRVGSHLAPARVARDDTERRRLREGTRDAEQGVWAQGAARRARAHGVRVRGRPTAAIRRHGTAVTAGKERATERGETSNREREMEDAVAAIAPVRQARAAGAPRRGVAHRLSGDVGVFVARIVRRHRRVNCHAHRPGRRSCATSRLVHSRSRCAGVARRPCARRRLGRRRRGGGGGAERKRQHSMLAVRHGHRMDVDERRVAVLRIGYQSHRAHLPPLRGGTRRVVRGRMARQGVGWACVCRGAGGSQAVPWRWGAG
jgi:hypothetical protein